MDTPSSFEIPDCPLINTGWLREGADNTFNKGMFRYHLGIHVPILSTAGTTLWKCRHELCVGCASHANSATKDELHPELLVSLSKSLGTNTRRSNDRMET